MFEDRQVANRRRTGVLMVGFVALVLAVGAALRFLLGFNWLAFVLSLVFAVGVPVVSYWYSDSITLRMSRARPASEEEYARFHNVIEGLCIATGLPKPALYVIDDDAPNAFATGRDPKHAAICATTGLLNRMTRVELEGVLAHELSHVQNRDTLVSTVAVVLVGVVTLLADWGIRWLWWGGGRTRHRSSEDRDPGGNVILFVLGIVLLLTAPLIGRVMQYAVSRSRESLADASAVAITRYPPGLISALEKLQADDTVVHAHSRATAHLWIESPIARVPAEGRLAWWNRLFETHPPLAERIQALKEM